MFLEISTGNVLIARRFVHPQTSFIVTWTAARNLPTANRSEVSSRQNTL